MSLAHQIQPNSIAAKAIAMRDGGNSLPAMVHRAATQLASATTAAEVLDARDYASVAYDAAKKAGRLAKAKGAHDELIAKAHRAQADALEIEATAKRRLADEYDAAQERGEVHRHGGQKPGDVENANIPKVSDLGLSRYDIHEARQIRDAEEADPGVIRRTLDEKLDAGEEPTKAAISKAVEAANKQGAETMDAAVEVTAPTRNPRVVINVPEGQDIAELCRRGLVHEEGGMSLDEAAAKIDLTPRAYRLGRQIVLLADNKDLSAKDAATAKRALDMLVETKQVVGAWEVAEPLVNRVWGEGKKDGLLSIHAKRLERFERSFGIIMQTCMTTDEVDLPYLSADRAKKAVRDISAARGALLRFAEKIKEIHE